MSNHDKHDIPVAYPPHQTKTTEGYSSNGPSVMPPPPIGYPTRDEHEVGGEGPASKFHSTTTRGEGFWKGCVAAICCCWVLDFCFGC